MKKFKKLAAFTASLMIAAASIVSTTGITGFAATNLTINKPGATAPDTENTYTAYQVFTGTVHEGGIITDVQWGSGVKSDELLTALKNDSTIGSSFTNCSSAADVAAAIKGFGNKTDKSNALAKVISDHLNGEGIDSSSGVISGLDDGYYFVKTKSGTTNTKYILTLVGNENNTVETKGDLAKVEKKVFEDSNSTWQDVADAEQGSEVKFRLYAELPSNYDEFKSYYLKFNDELAMPGFKDQDSNDNTYTAVKDDFVKYYLIKAGSDTPVDITSTAKSSFTTVLNDSNVNDNKVDFSFECLNVKGINAGSATIEAGDKIVVEYATDLDENAIVTPKTGNDNAVTLEYSNNPNSESEGSTAPGDEDKGETPKDEVRVLTYQENLNKVDGETKAQLEGAGFAIKNADNKYATFDSNGSITGWVTDYDASKCVVTSDTNGNAVIKGLDSGDYTLEEKVVPAGYNGMSPKNFTITATYDTTVPAFTADTNPLTELTSTLGTGDNTTGEIDATIENAKGSSLPSTGGMGTTMFYVGGGILAVGSGALLLAKKRMKNKEN